MDCKDIVSGILEGGYSKELAIEAAYKQFINAVYKIASNYNLNVEDIIEDFTDAILLFAEKVEAGEFIESGNNSCFSYVYRTLSNYALNRRKKRRISTVNLFPGIDKADEPISDEMEERYEKYEAAFAELSEKCQYLISSGLQSIPAKNVAEKLGMKSANAVAVSRHRCKEKLIKIIKERGWV